MNICKFKKLIKVELKTRKYEDFKYWTFGKDNVTKLKSKKKMNSLENIMHT